jgi:hypothetical protein
MARPRKKPDYDAEKIMAQFLHDVAECYEESPKVSLRDVAAEFDITLLKVRKILITVGEYTTDISEQVQDLRKQGKTIPEIMEITGLSRASVHSYLPYKKGIYNAKEASLDAERCKKYRQRKSTVTQLKEKPDNMEFLWDAMVAFAGYPFQTYPKGLKFKYEVKGNEIFVNRKKKSITRATVVLAYQNMRKMEIKRAKELVTFGASYLYPVFIRLGVK